MIDFLQSIAAFIVALGILITFHEFGHFCIARLFDVRILRFSIGFGRPIWKRYFGKDRSEFVIAALPLGGYVKMLDEREGEVTPGERIRAFNNKSIGQRFAIVIAGPGFNFIFAVFAYWAVYMFGVTGLRPIVAGVDAASLAGQAGIQQGDEIIGVDDHPTPTWSAVIEAFVSRVVKQQRAKITLRAGNGSDRESYLNLSRVSVDEMASGRLLTTLGLHPKIPLIPAVIGKIIGDGPADRAGLLAGDRIIAVNGKAIEGWREWVAVIRKNPGTLLHVELLRSNGPHAVDIVPDSVLTDSGERTGQIGAVADDSFQSDHTLTAIESYSLVPAFIKALDKTTEMSVMTLRLLGKMIIGEASVKNLSGPISIAQYAGHTAGLGVTAFLGFLAIVSVSLCVLNLLPIPVLDGGHLMYYLVELVKGSPVSETTQVIGQQVGLAILLSLMGLTFYNDILRLVG
ncbi:MAG: RIP metalloprotease RseP [Gammaproteobacteria bacterium]